MQPPTVGRIVHYVSHGSPVQPDGTQAYPSRCRAAIITETTDADGTVSLAVLNPTGVHFDQAVPHAEHKAAGAPAHPGGTWHWPERA